jgi:hypothetical protein
VGSPAAGDHKAVLVAYPVAFDWSFLYWYFERFAASGSPFGYSSCLDIRTLYQASAGTVHGESGQNWMPAALLPASPHTHNALDDAIEQGELFANVFEWGRAQAARVGSGNAQQRNASADLARQSRRQRTLSPPGALARLTETGDAPTDAPSRNRASPSSRRHRARPPRVVLIGASR